ncbi:hypothetical protein PR202_ga31616 [Eleusine coracana subsp. coracana]|uniref:C3H1-type domain-containing protein n=1 Tax=Eleusine coracana subsp. coracana TaxID=191504 RepID=A0AAV5DSK2_ELECO|nr:hypothetical protein PR202_ga31616 [Eleusine coracana subsp. coracana]
MADADAKPPPPGDAAATSPIPSIPPSDAATAAIEEQLAGLGLTVAGGGAGFEPSGWDDGPVPVDIGVEEVVPFSGDKVQAAVSSPVGDARVRYPQRPGEPDCSYYVKFGTCRFGTKCKFNHPARKKKSKVKGSGGSSGSNSSSNKASSPDDDQAPKEEYEGLAPDISDSSNSTMKYIFPSNFLQGFDDKGSASNLVQGGDDKGSAYTTEKHRKTSYETSAEPEKGFYFRKLDETNVTKHKISKAAKDKRKESVTEGSAQEECKVGIGSFMTRRIFLPCWIFQYYGMPGGCKFGKACKYLHHEGKEGKTEAEKVDLNFLGLPLRPGEKECPYYMRTGSCKYATNCKFHHPDPSNASSKEPVLEHENGDTPQQTVQGPSQTSVPIWPDQRAMNEQHVPFLAPAQSYNAGMMPPQGVYPSPDWSGFHQVPLNPYYPPGVPFQHFTAHLNHPMYKTADIPGHQQVATDDYPERPGQPECQHFDQPVCTYYGRFGVCKYGPACMFNHPFNFGPPVHAAGPPVPGQYPTPANFTV